MYDWVFLAMPEPAPGLAERRFRERWLTRPTEEDEGGEERCRELREVGRALRGLASRGRQLFAVRRGARLFGIEGSGVVN